MRERPFDPRGAARRARRRTARPGEPSGSAGAPRRRGPSDASVGEVASRGRVWPRFYMSLRLPDTSLLGGVLPQFVGRLTVHPGRGVPRSRSQRATTRAPRIPRPSRDHRFLSSLSILAPHGGERAAPSSSPDGGPPRSSNPCLHGSCPYRQLAEHSGGSAKLPPAGFCGIRRHHPGDPRTCPEGAAPERSGRPHRTSEHVDSDAEAG